MRITPFAVEQWMNAYETKCRYNLAETCVESLTIAELLDMAGQRGSILEELLPLQMTYGSIEGSIRLRTAVAALYSSRSGQDVLVTHGAIGANALVYQGLVEPGDRVISIVPNYQQHYSIPESLGADVQRLALRSEQAYLPDLDALRRLITPRTKMIAFSNPNNPTGSLMDREILEEIADIAAHVGAYVLSDEVYRGTSQDGDSLTPSVTDLYDKGISIGSMSKAFSLAGFRLGWICGPPEVLRAAEIHRDYNTISVGILDDVFSSIALESRDKVLARSRGIVRTNLEILDRWMDAEDALSYVKPRAGTITLLKYAFDIPSQDLCVSLLRQTGVLLTPGSAFDAEGTVRIGYANNSAILEEGLRRTSDFLRQLNTNDGLLAVQ